MGMIRGRVKIWLRDPTPQGDLYSGGHNEEINWWIE